MTFAGKDLGWFTFCFGKHDFEGLRAGSHGSDEGFEKKSQPETTRSESRAPLKFL